ncbi:5-hydroxytryptamine receptor 1B-like [Oculina patagonica]
MELNETETATLSSSSTFHCSHTPFSWDLNVSSLHWLIDTIALIASPCTILLNAMVILVMKRSRELQKTSNILLSSLAVTDLLIGVIVMPLSVTADFLILSQASFAHTCLLGLVNVFFMFFLFFASLYHLTIIAWERYVAIQKWKDYKVIVTNGRLKKLAIAAWLSALFAAVPILIMSVVDVDHKIVEGWYTICAFMGAVCLILILFFYRKVYLGIRNRNINEISQVTAVIKVKLESKVAKTTGLLTAALMSSFIPIFGFEILGNFFPVFRTSIAVRFTDTLTQLNSLFNPLLYCYRDRRFRNALRELLGKKKPQAPQPAVEAARFVRRKVPIASAEQHNTAKPTRRLTRSTSCNPPEVLDSLHGRPRDEVTLKRSLSAPTLSKCSSSFDGLDRQKPSSITITSATIHVESSVQRKARENNSESTSDMNKPQVIRNKSRSKSCHPIASVKFADRWQGTVRHQDTQHPNERSNTAPATFMV